MRSWQWSGLVLLLVLLGAPGVRADEPAGEGAERHAAAGVAERALEALKLRLDARIKEGELLAKAGRIEEALEAYRSVGLLYEQGMQQVRKLIGDLPTGSGGPAAQGDEPFATSAPAGGAFAGRARARQSQPEGAAKRTAGQAVEDGLAWLAAHQSPDGHWGAAEFVHWCDGQPAGEQTPEGAGKALYDVGVTGLALMAFLGAGYTNHGRHAYAKVVADGLRYLKGRQDAEGCFGPRSTQQYVYNHAVACLVMVEAYGMTGSHLFKGSAQRGLDFIAAARNPYMAWRYGVKPGDNDTSVTAWMMMALKSADLINKDAIKRGKEAPLTTDAGAFDGARAWLDKVTDPDLGRVGYVQRGTGPARPQEMVDRFPAEKSEAMTAAGILMRVFLGEDPRKSDPIRKGADLCRKLPPVWNTEDGSIDMMYWYFGTLSMFQVGGKHWQDWNAALKPAVVETQRLDTTACLYKGSWDPAGVWGNEGGRVASTALMTLILQVYFRYNRVFGQK